MSTVSTAVSRRKHRQFRTWIRRYCSASSEELTARAESLGLGPEGGPLLRTTVWQLADLEIGGEICPGSYDSVVQSAVANQLAARSESHQALVEWLDSLDRDSRGRLADRVAQHLDEHNVAIDDVEALLSRVLAAVRKGPATPGGWECGGDDRRRVGFLLWAAETLGTQGTLPDIHVWAFEQIKCAPDTIGPIGVRRDGSVIEADTRGGMITAIGPPGSGKSSTLTSAAMSWPGPVVLTTTKPADWDAGLLAARLEVGPVYVFDLTDRVELPHPDVRLVRWSPLQSVTDWDSAVDRSNEMTQTAPLGGVDDPNFWNGQAARLLSPLLFAASFASLPISTVASWVDSQEEAEPMSVLTRAGVEEAALAFVASMRQEERLRSSVYATVGLTTSAFTRASVRKVTDEPGFDIEHDLLRSNGTVLIYADPTDAVSVRPLFQHFVSDVIQVRKHLADQLWRGPSLFLGLDEVANTVPIRSLPSLISEGPGRGLTGFLCLQDLSQVNRWGREGELFLTASGRRLIFPGTTSADLHRWVLNIADGAPPRRAIGFTPSPAIPRSADGAALHRPVDVAQPGAGQVILVGPDATVEVVGQARAHELPAVVQAGHEASILVDGRNAEVVGRSADPSPVRLSGSKRMSNGRSV